MGFGPCPHPLDPFSAFLIAAHSTVFIATFKATLAALAIFALVLFPRL